jgi:hypothetical protein
MISAQRLDQVTTIVERAGLNAQTVAMLRETFGDMHLTHCLDDDIGVAEPVRRTAGFNVYLVGGSGHCMRITGDADAATGLVLAERDGTNDDD